MKSSSGKATALARADALGRLIENAFLSLLLAGMIGFGALQIILRWSGAGSLVWADEAIRLMVLWIAMIAGVAAAREDRHISIDVLSRFLSPRVRGVAAAIVDLFTAAVCFALAWYGGVMVQYAFEDDDIVLTGLPAWIFQAVIPVAFLLMGYRYMLWFLRRAAQNRTGEQQ